MSSTKSFAIALFTAVIAVFPACGGEGNKNTGDHREFTLQGQVLALSADHKEANIKHEDIPGFMPAMTMPYKVEDAKEFESIAPGDLINATLVVVSNDAYLQNVKKVGSAPLEKVAGESGAPPAAAEMLKDGQPVPNTSFVDQDGKKRDLASFKGIPLVLTFIYTRCPMPTFCPLMDRHFATIQQKLKSDPLDIHLVTVSFDPDHDTPAVLKKHAKELGANPKVWTFLTGDRETIDKFASRFGVSVARAADEKGEINITHNLRTAIVGPDGKLVQTYTGNEWTPTQDVADLKKEIGA